MSSLIRASSSTKITQNNRIVHDKSSTLQYDGNTLDIYGNKNGKEFVASLTNKDIHNLISLPANKLSLVERLENDLVRLKGTKTKSAKNKSAKNKSVKNKSTKNKSAKNKSVKNKSVKNKSAKNKTRKH